MTRRPEVEDSKPLMPLGKRGVDKRLQDNLGSTSEESQGRCDIVVSRSSESANLVKALITTFCLVRCNSTCALLPCMIDRTLDKQQAVYHEGRLLGGGGCVPAQSGEGADTGSGRPDGVAPVLCSQKMWGTVVLALAALRRNRSHAPTLCPYLSSPPRPCFSLSRH
jgi:hypothetical protein